jgi:hypothetical protein
MLFIFNKLNNFSIKALLLIINIAIIVSAKKKKTKAKANYTSRVVNLTDDSFGQFNKTNNLFFLFFTSNDCKRCDFFYPQYQHLSDQLYNSNWKIPCVLVNKDQNPNLANHYNVTKTPKIYFANYVENEFLEYHGRNTPKSLVEYANHHLNYTTEEITKWDDILKRKKGGDFIMFVGDIKKYEGIYKKVIKASKEEDVDQILWTTSPEIYEKFGIDKNSFDVVMFDRKKKDIKIKGVFNVKEENTVSEIEKLIQVYDRKHWGKTDEFSLLLALEANPPTPSVFVIYSQKNKEQLEYNKELSSLFENLSKQYIRDFHFMNMTISSNLAVPFISTFNLTKKNTPYVVLVDHNENYEDDVDKYLFPVEQKINEENIKKFLSDFKSKKLQKNIFSKSIEPLGTFREGIHHLVGKDYENFLFKETVGKDVLFYLYSEYSDLIFDLMNERVNNTIKKLQGNNHLVFARSNPLLNELQEFPIESLPALFLIRGDNENERRRSINKYKMESFTTKNFVEFVKQSSSKSITENPLENEESIYKDEVENELFVSKKETEEEYIDFDNENAGLRRYSKFLLEDNDSDDDDEEIKKSKKKKKTKTKSKSKSKKDSEKKDDL